MLTGVLYDVVQELQMCMAPLMNLNGDDIVEALLLEAMRNEPRTCPIPEEEATLLGEELELPDTPEATASLQECPETPVPKEPTKWINAVNIPADVAPTSKPHHDSCQKPNKSW